MGFSKKNRKTVRCAVAFSCILMICSISVSETLVAPSSVHSTIAKALFAAKSGDTVLVENGVFAEKVKVKPGVFLKARSQFKSILDGQGKGPVATLAGGAGICGFEIRNGTIGVVSNTVDNVITHCLITGMTESGISCSGQVPLIEDNFIVYNKGSGIQGWDLQPATGSINHNTIAFNANNGVACGGKSTVNLDNNIIANNQRLGLKIDDETVVVHLNKNVFFENGSMSYIIKLDGNFTCDPKFVEPKKMHFAMHDDSQCKHKADNDQDPGARGGF